MEVVSKVQGHISMVKQDHSTSCIGAIVRPRSPAHRLSIGMGDYWMQRNRLEEREGEMWLVDSLKLGGYF